MNRSWSEGEKKGDWGFGDQGLCIGLTEEETEFSRKHSVSFSKPGWVERLKANDN